MSFPAAKAKQLVTSEQSACFIHAHAIVVKTHGTWSDADKQVTFTLPLSTKHLDVQQHLDGREDLDGRARKGERHI
jgi:hypothetical protein